jgi:hypothetical protein
MAKKRESNKNYFTVTPGEVIRLFVDMYKGDFASQPTKMLWGQPGVGKSQAIHQLAEKLEEATKKKVEVHLVSLLLMNPIDLRGIPSKAVNEAGKEVTRWIQPEIFQMDPSPDKIHILFLDEISAAVPSVQAAAYQIALEKRIGEFYLPDNCFVICAGNRVTDKAVAYTMPKPLANRMTHFEVVSDIADWKVWAYQHNVDPLIIGYLDSQPDDLNEFNSDNDDVAFATPRSWEMVDTYCKAAGLRELLDEKAMLMKSKAFNPDHPVSTKLNSLFKMIAGSIGMGIALKFKTYLDVYRLLPNFDDIAEGRVREVDKGLKNRMDVIHALSAMISSRVTKYSYDVKPFMKKKETQIKVNKFLTNVGRYISSLPNTEFKAWVTTDMFASVDPDFKPYIMQNEAFIESYDAVADVI